MPRRLPDIDPDRCTGCGRCIAACGPHVLALERRGWEKVLVLLDAQGCTGCHHCAWRCPFEAIAMLYRTSRRESELTPRIRPPCGAMDSDRQGSFKVAQCKPPPYQFKPIASMNTIRLPGKASANSFSTRACRSGGVPWGR
jgi:NAD-dependent dihydropyrimidine dehydrogenase PreA subunit